jgi:hypothetical protein
MDGRGAGVGFPILLGAYLLYSNVGESKVFSGGPQATYHAALSALGAFLLILGLVFLFKNLKQPWLTTLSVIMPLKNAHVVEVLASVCPRTLIIAPRVAVKVVLPCFSQLESVPAVTGTDSTRTAWTPLVHHVPVVDGHFIGCGRNRLPT